MPWLGCAWSGAGVRGDDCQREMGELTLLVLSVSAFFVPTSACACDYIYLYISIPLSVDIHTPVWREGREEQFSAPL